MKKIRIHTISVCMILFCRCAKEEFKLEVIDASIFDIEFVDDKILSDRFKDDFYDKQFRLQNTFACISITFDLYFTNHDYHSWGMAARKDYLRRTYGRKYANDPIRSRGDYDCILRSILFELFGKDYFQEVHWENIDFKENVIKNCTVSGIILNENRYQNKDIKIIFDRKSLITSYTGREDYPDYVPEYKKEITFNYDRLTIPNYSNINEFIASLKNITIKRTFNASYVDLFKDFIPSNPKKGYYMLFTSPSDNFFQTRQIPSVNPDAYANDKLHNTLNPNEAQLIIYEEYSTGLINMEYYNSHGNRIDDGTFLRTGVKVYDLISRKVIYNNGSY